MTIARWCEKFVAVRKVFSKSIDDFRTNFVATRTRRGSNRDAHLLGARSVQSRHTLQRLSSDRRQRPSPTGMNRRERARLRIANQNRHAVGSLNNCQNIFSFADDGIAVIVVSTGIGRRLCFARLIDYANIATVNLPAAGQRPLAREKLEKAPTILHNVVRRIFVKAGEVERATRIGWHRTDAADAR